MAAIEANTIVHGKTKTTEEPVRPIVEFPPSEWGDLFLNFTLDKSEFESYAKAMEQPKEEVKKLINDPTMDSNAKLTLIYSLDRLGLRYVFLDDMEGQLDKLFKELNLKDYEEADLYTISVHFQAFRLLGYRMSCDVFNKFRDSSSGKFKEYIIADVRGMLKFNEAAQLRIKGEPILDEAFEFTDSQLRRVLNTLEGNLATQVKYALWRPLHRGVPMVEARQYFSNYEEEFSSYDSLKKLAKLHFKYLQLLQKEELRILVKWHKDLDIQSVAPYARDRTPELYVWILALYLEPYYSQARIITTKVIVLNLILDDTYDAYGTIEELRLLLQALDRWDISALEILPENLKAFYKICLNEFADYEKQVAKEGKPNSVEASRKAFVELARAYLEEAEWRHADDPPLFNEYMRNGLVTSTHEFLTKSALMGMGDIVTKEALAWYETHPKFLSASELISRLHDDISTYEFERERAACATSVEAYMKTYGVSEEEAVTVLKKMVDDAWKVINEGCLKPRELKMDLLAPPVNLAKMIDVAYKYDDGFTFPEKIFKVFIIQLFIDPCPE